MRLNKVKTKSNKTKKKASEVSMTDRFLPDKSSSEISEDGLKKTSTTILSSLLELATTHPDVLDSLVNGLKTEQLLPKEDLSSNQE